MELRDSDQRKGPEAKDKVHREGNVTPATAFREARGAHALPGGACGPPDLARAAPGIGPQVPLA